MSLKDRQDFSFADFQISKFFSSSENGSTFHLDILLIFIHSEEEKILSL